jgi:hypothetical protein
MGPAEKPFKERHHYFDGVPKAPQTRKDILHVAVRHSLMTNLLLLPNVPGMIMLQKTGYDLHSRAATDRNTASVDGELR